MSLVPTPYFITSKPALKSLLQYAPVWGLCSVSSRDASVRDLSSKNSCTLQNQGPADLCGEPSFVTRPGSWPCPWITSSEKEHCRDVR